MPLRWDIRRTLPLSPRSPEAPIFVMAAPGSIRPRQRVTQALAAGSLLIVAFRPLPAPRAPAPASPFVVSNLNPLGPGSLAQAVQDANAHPGADTINFQSGLTGTISAATQIVISDSVQIFGPG